MTNKEKYELCFSAATEIVAEYRKLSTIDVQNFAASTISAITAVVAVVAAGISAAGMYQQGQAQKKIANYNAKVSENSAIASRQEAEAAAARLRERADRLRSAQVAGASKSGILLSGSVNDVMYDSSIQSELDALTAIYKGDRAADTAESQAAITRYEGKTASRLMTINAAGTLLSGAAQGAGYWSQSRNYAAIENAQKGNQPKFP